MPKKSPCRCCGSEMDEYGRCPNIYKKWPGDGDNCCCGGTIHHMGNIDWEHGYRCDKCHEEWWYD